MAIPTSLHLLHNLNKTAYWHPVDYRVNMLR